MPEKKRFRIEWYRGSIKPANLVNINENKERIAQYHTYIRAQNKEQAIEFGLMRRPGLIVVVTDADDEKGKENNA